MFEIELYPQNTKNSFKAIFKVGDYIDMEREKDLFDKINGNCDNSFTPVLRISELKDWKIGIIYKHANVFLNARLIILKEYIESLGYTMDEVMVLGDSLNDYSMISMDFGATVAMENAVPEIKKAAKYITKSNNEFGVAYAIDQVLERQGK